MLNDTRSQFLSGFVCVVYVAVDLINIVKPISFLKTLSRINYMDSDQVCISGLCVLHVARVFAFDMDI